MGLFLDSIQPEKLLAYRQLNLCDTNKMNIKLLAKESIRSMTSNKVRTLLTILGMVIGITAIMIVFSAGNGIKGLLFSQIESFGTDFVQVEVRVPSDKKGAGDTDSGMTSKDTDSAMSMAMGVQITTLKTEDMEDINKLSNVKNSYGAIVSQDLVSYQEKRKKINIYGVSSAFIEIDKSEIEFGRFFSDAEDRSLSEVVVVGSKVKNDLFGEGDAVGQSIKVGKNKFKVIGVLKERGATMGMDFDSLIYLPLKTLQKKIMGIDYMMYTIHQLNDTSIAYETAEEIRSLLRENHEITPRINATTGIADASRDDFRVTTLDEMMKMMDTIMGATTMLLLAIVIISLIVGGVGIMNIMYVIVSERTKEIGLRKSVGAKYMDIMNQFLFESILITLLGAILGIIFGIIFSYLIAVGARSQGLDWKFSIPLSAYFVAMFFSLFFGIFFGLMPARKAAKMDPITALRNE